MFPSLWMPSSWLFTSILPASMTMFESALMPFMLESGEQELPPPIMPQPPLPLWLLVLLPRQVWPPPAVILTVGSSVVSPLVNCTVLLALMPSNADVMVMVPPAIFTRPLPSASLAVSSSSLLMPSPLALTVMFPPLMVSEAFPLRPQFFAVTFSVPVLFLILRSLLV